jgi:hypothetical protein
MATFGIIRIVAYRLNKMTEINSVNNVGQRKTRVENLNFPNAALHNKYN